MNGLLPVKGEKTKLRAERRESRGQHVTIATDDGQLGGQRSEKVRLHRNKRTSEIRKKRFSASGRQMFNLSSSPLSAAMATTALPVVFK